MFVSVSAVRNVLCALTLGTASATHAQVPAWPEYASYVVYVSGDVVYVPDTHEVVIQPKNGWNTAPFTWKNLYGIHNNRWPFLDAICDYIEQPVVGPGPAVEQQPVCDEPNYVLKPSPFN